MLKLFDADYCYHLKFFSSSPLYRNIPSKQKETA